MLENLNGHLVGTLGLEKEVAVAIVSLIGSGGLWTAAAVYPVIAPFIGTISGIIAVSGTAMVVGF